MHDTCDTGNKCTCGEIESVEHFLLSCDNYSLDREKLRQSLYFKTGTLNLDLEELLNTEASADIQYAVSEFIDDTQRFDHLFL